MSDKDEFEKARDERFLRWLKDVWCLMHIRSSHNCSEKDARAGFHEGADWARDYFQAEIEKRDKVIGELVEVLRKTNRKLNKRGVRFTLAEETMLKAKVMLK